MDWGRSIWASAIYLQCSRNRFRSLNSNEVVWSIIKREGIIVFHSVIECELKNAVVSLLKNMLIKEGMWWNGVREKGFEDTEQMRGSRWAAAIGLSWGQLLGGGGCSPEQRNGGGCNENTAQYRVRPSRRGQIRLRSWLKPDTVAHDATFVILVWFLRKESWLPK